MNYKVTETAANIRGVARSALKDNWKKVILGMIVYLVIMELVTNLLTALFPTRLNNTILNTTINYPFISYVYMGIISGPATLGIVSFTMYFFRRKDINPGYIFNGFGHFFKSLGMQFMRGLLIGWPMLICYAGLFYAGSVMVGDANNIESLSGLVVALFFVCLLLIIAATVYAIMQIFSYSQCFYLLSTELMNQNNESKLGILGCLKESKRIMNGNRMKLFSVEFSYIGWAIVASIPLSMATEVLQSSDMNRVAVVIIQFIFTLPMAVYYAYFQTGEMVFHDILVGKLVAKAAQPGIEQF